MYIGLEKKMSKEELDYGVIDDFLPLNTFKEIQEILLETNPKIKHHVAWHYLPTVVQGQEKKEIDWRVFSLIHEVFANQTIMSPVYEQIEPITKLIGIGKLTRIKINMYPNTQSVQEHGMHVDYPWQHKTALFSINTCDGYTKLEDGTKIDSVANRMLLFDGRIKHTSSTCTNQVVRVNININYF